MRDRKVHWLWEAKGGWGKTEMSLYMCDQMGAMVLSGRNLDCLHGIASWIDKMGSAPPIVILDVPRVNNGHVSYQTIESIKNGVAFSGKYESCQIRFDRPHLVVFSNEPPDMTKLSPDRWVVTELKDHTCGKKVY